MATNNQRNPNNLVQALLTDKYQVSMCYAYWRDGKHLRGAVFDLFFRKNPFRGEFTVYSGLEECLKFLANFRFSPSDLEYLRAIPDYAHLDPAFWQYLAKLDASSVKLLSLNEGSVCFPNLPLMRLEGPLGLLQLLETALLNLINYASLVTTNAARYRLAAKSDQPNVRVRLLEFGLRRAQGPDGGFSASRYAFIGGFDATSNLLAGKLFGIPVSGTIGHAFILSYFGSTKLTRDSVSEHKFLLNRITGKEADFTLCCLDVEANIMSQVKLEPTTSDNNPSGPLTGSGERSELKAFISFAWSFPESFLVLVDTYDVIKSGLVNFCIVAIALIKFGYKPVGVRIDSGDLAYLSKYANNLFRCVSLIEGLGEFAKLEIVASNDLNEETINSLNDQNHAITSMGIGTNLVTCQSQPALGCVYKLVETEGTPCLKLSSIPQKINIPCKKSAYRFFGASGAALIDFMSLHDEPAPQVGVKVLCRHPFIPEKRCYATPSRVEPLLVAWWDGKQIKEFPDLIEVRSNCQRSLEYLTEDIKRSLNPTPYKVSVSEKLFQLLNQLKVSLTPIGELS